MIINGDMFIAQRGGTYSLTTSSAYGSIDRWASLQTIAAAGIFNQSGGSTNTFPFYAKLGRTAASGGLGTPTMATALESYQSYQAQGSTVVLSFYAYSGANFSAAASTMNVALIYGTGTDQSMANMLTGGWTGYTLAINTTQVISSSVTRYSFNCVLPTSVTQLGVKFWYTPVGTAGADDNMYITGVQLERVPTGVTTPSLYEYINPALSILACQRYYQRISCTALSVASAGSQNIGASVNYPVATRTTPNVAQVSDGYAFAGVNVTATTSTYIVGALTSSLVAYRTSSAAGSCQFSEVTSLSAEL